MRVSESESEWPINLFTHMGVCGAYTRVRERIENGSSHQCIARERSPGGVGGTTGSKIIHAAATYPCHVHQMNVMCVGGDRKVADFFFLLFLLGGTFSSSSLVSYLAT